MKILKTYNTNKDILVDDFNYDRLKHLKIQDKYGTLGVQIWNKFLKRNIIISFTKIILLTDKYIIDHKDLNYLNCQIENLRPCSYKQNCYNKGLNKNNSSGYKGVSPHKALNKWSAYIKYNYKKIHIGYFNTKEEAAKAYDKKALELFGEFSVLNFPQENKREVVNVSSL